MLSRCLKIVVSFLSVFFTIDLGLAQSGNHTDSTFLLSEDSLFIGEKKPSHWQTAGTAIRRFALSVPGDFVEMKNVVTKDWRTSAAYVGGIGVLIFADKPLTKFYQDKVEPAIDYRLPSLPGAMGAWHAYSNAYLNYSLLGLYVGSFAANYSTGQRAVLNSLKAISYSFGISHVALKAIFARQRPDPTLSDGVPPQFPYTTSPFEFFHFRKLYLIGQPDGTSFPSFHSTAYFAVAKVMAMEFNNYWIPYGAIGFLFLANIDGHQHWVSDMVAGGIIGSLIGKGIVKSSKKWDEKNKKNNFGIVKNPRSIFNYKVYPNLSSNAFGFSILASF